MDFAHGAYSKGTLSIPVSDGIHSPAKWVMTTSTGSVKFYKDDGGVSGTGLFVPIAGSGGIFGFGMSVSDGVGTVHSASSMSAQAP